MTNRPTVGPRVPRPDECHFRETSPALVDTVPIGYNYPMIGYVKTAEDKDKKRRKHYVCANCGALITESGALFKINGSDEHSYTNPAGVRCNFMTVLECENVLVHEDLYTEHSWFPAYGWRFLLCQVCLLHLGWKWDAVEANAAPDGFFGVLLDSVKTVSPEE